MAARVIVLTFKDEKAAEQFARIKTSWEEDETEAPENVEAEVLTLGAIVAAQTKLEAVVAKPSNPCRCTRNLHVNKGGSGYTKTVKFGWWVHAACGKPAARVVQDFIKNMIQSSGNDLLPDLKAQFLAEQQPTEPLTVDSPVYNDAGSLLRVDQVPASEGVATDAPADAQGQEQAAQGNEAPL